MKETIKTINYLKFIFDYFILHINIHAYVRLNDD